AGILQGRVAVICDNSPFALVIPIQMVTLFQANEDHYNLAIHSFLLRTVRIIGWLAATMAPGLYIGIASFNPGILPAHAVMTIAAARQGVPYPPVIEVLIMDIALEMLAEASVRLPTYVGGAATVVGGLILGTAAAQARLVSNVMIIVVALTAIGSFSIPDYQNQLSWRTMKYLYTLSSAFLGIIGLTTAGLIILVYVCSVDVLGVPYMSPIAPWRWTAMMKDVAMRMPDPLAVKLEEQQREEEAEGTADA
ncbi:MAG TPA: spore germination protein, partial [Candidatus Hydrogenedentes bacterium]|nr:spore germination protein [Candidatus Hydrogenedentota bacterium]